MRLVEENQKNLVYKKPPTFIKLVEKNQKTLTYTPSSKGYDKKEPINHDYVLVIIYQ